MLQKISRQTEEYLVWITTHRNKDWWVWSPDKERPGLSPLAP
jgi:hypothetical protein